MPFLIKEGKRYNQLTRCTSCTLSQRVIMSPIWKEFMNWCFPSVESDFSAESFKVISFYSNYSVYRCYSQDKHCSTVVVVTKHYPISDSRSRSKLNQIPHWFLVPSHLVFKASDCALKNTDLLNSKCLKLFRTCIWSRGNWFYVMNNKFIIRECGLGTRTISIRPDPLHLQTLYELDSTNWYGLNLW